MFHVKVGAFIHLASCCCFISPLFRVRDGPKSPNQVCVRVCVCVRGGCRSLMFHSLAPAIRSDFGRSRIGPAELKHR